MGTEDKGDNQDNPGEDRPSGENSGNSGNLGNSGNSGKETPDQAGIAGQQVILAQQLHRINRSRSRLMVCFYTLPLYVIALVLLLNEGRSITTFMFVYMAVYAVFAVDMVIRVCPRCGEQFFVKSFLLNFFARRCVHCGLSCHAPSAGGSADEGRHF